MLITKRDFVENMKYFVTLTFPPEKKNLSEKEKIELFKKGLNRVKFWKNHKFEYFGVVERETKIEEKKDEKGNYLHFHMIITDGNHNGKYIKESGNKTIGVNLKNNNLNQKEITNKEGILNYILKEGFLENGMSLELFKHKKEWLLKIEEENFINILNYIYKNKLSDKEIFELADGIEKIECNIKKIIGIEEKNGVEEEIKLEKIMYGIFDKKDKETLYHGLKKIDIRLKEEKLYEKLKNIFENKAIRDKIFNNGGRLAKNCLREVIGFLLGKYCTYAIRLQDKIYKDFIDEIVIILNSVKTKKEVEKEKKEDNLKNALYVYGCITEVMKDYIEIYNYHYDKKTYIKIRFAKKGEDIPGPEKLRKLKGKGLSVSKPKDGKIYKLNEEGGYILNGKEFKQSLMKPRLENKLGFKKQKGLKAVNILQNQELEIDKKLYTFLRAKEKEIKERLFDNKTEEQFLKEIREKNHLIREGCENKEEEKQYKLEKKELQGKKSKLYMFNTILEEAEIYIKYEKLYSVQSVDERGRIYPIPDFLSYVGNKLARALIRFKKKSKFDELAFKLYAYSLGGQGDLLASEKERIEYFDIEIKEKIESYRENGCGLEADEPGLFLAICIEGERYQICQTDYYTNLPIYLDASCSGSQIISLLFNIDEHAESLNLTEKDENSKKGDFYGEVITNFLASTEDSELIEKLIEKLRGKDYLGRKLFKHKIMTMNYGLTRLGLLKKLIEKVEENKIILEEKEIKGLAKVFWEYLVNLPIYQYLAEVEKRINANKKIVLYTNFKGFCKEKEAIFKYSQFYTKEYKKRFKVYIKTDSEKISKIKENKMTYYLAEYGTIDKSKQRLAFRANIIHHLDSLLVHNIVIKMKKEKKEVLPIHDSFGVLMSDIEKLKEVAKESYKELLLNPDNIYGLLYHIKLSSIEKDKLTKKEKKELKRAAKRLREKGKKIDLEKARYLIFQ